MLGVERLDAGARLRQHVRVARQRLGGGIAEVGQQREVNVRIDIAERLHFEMCEQLLTCATLSSIVGTITIVRASAGPRSNSSRGSRRGGIR